MRVSKRILIGVLFAIAATIGILAWYSAYRSTRELELQATRVIVAWAFDGQPMPGFEEVEQVPGIGEVRYAGGYVSSTRMREADRWYVVCDFLPRDTLLSDDPRIERIPDIDAQFVSQALSTGEGSFLLIVFLQDESGPVSRSRHEIKLSVITSYAALGGDMYEFTFTKIDGQLNVTGRHTGSS